MKKRILLIPLALLLAISLIAIGCPAQVEPVEEIPAKATYEWRANQLFASPDILSHRGMEKFMALVEEASDGRIKITHFPGDVLGDWTFVMEQVMVGAIEVAMTFPPAHFDPRWGFASLGYVVFDWDQARAAYAPGGWAIEPFAELAEDINAKLLGIWPAGFVSIAGTGPYATTPEEARALGIKLRVMPFKLVEVRWDALGYIATPIPFAELHSAMMLGIVDARSQAVYYENWLFRDVKDWVVETRDGFEVWPFLINLDVWKGLSEEDQQIVQAAADEVLDWGWQLAEQEEIEWRRKCIEEDGQKWIQLTPEELRVKAEIVRDVEWAFAEEHLIGKVLMDKIRAGAPPIP